MTDHSRFQTEIIESLSDHDATFGNLYGISSTNSVNEFATALENLVDSGVVERHYGYNFKSIGHTDNLTSGHLKQMKEFFTSGKIISYYMSGSPQQYSTSFAAMMSLIADKQIQIERVLYFSLKKK